MKIKKFLLMFFVSLVLFNLAAIMITQACAVATAEVMNDFSLTYNIICFLLFKCSTHRNLRQSSTKTSAFIVHPSISSYRYTDVLRRPSSDSSKIIPIVLDHPERFDLFRDFNGVRKIDFKCL